MESTIWKSLGEFIHLLGRGSLVDQKPRVTITNISHTKESGKLDCRNAK
jgi:hypothetical protein